MHLDEELDAELAREAARRGQSKAELIRQAARELLDAREDKPDGWAELTGMVKGLPRDDRHHDEIVYG